VSPLSLFLENALNTGCPPYLGHTGSIPERNTRYDVTCSPTQEDAMDWNRVEGNRSKAR
jgi:hypothetical protein